jgi:transcriptional regulator with XRE-family HTH domain
MDHNTVKASHVQVRRSTVAIVTFDDDGAGARIRRLRKRAGLTQAEFGTRMSRSQGWVSGVEKGDLELDSVTLINRAARVLNVHPNEVTGRPYNPGSPTEDRGHASITAIRRVVQRYDLPPDWPVEPRPIEQLRESVDELTWLRRVARYAHLGEAAPDVLREVHAACHAAPAGPAAEALYGLLARAYKEADAVAHALGYDDLSTLTTERFRWAAARSGDPRLVAIGDFLRVRELWALDLWSDAVEVIDSALTGLAPEADRFDRSVWGSLQLRAAITTARACDAPAAWDRVRYAQEAASSLEGGFDPYELTFTAANVQVHAVAVAVEMRDGARALELAENTRLPRTLPPSRRSHYHLDVARGALYHGDYDQALVQLETAERTAPMLVRNHPMARSAVRALLTRQRISGERLRRIAERMHVKG